MVILFPFLGLLAIMCIPASVFLLTMAFDHSRLSKCIECRYDLRGLPTRRCPECGFLNPSVNEHVPNRRHRLLFALGLLFVAMPIALVAYVMFSVVTMPMD